MQLRCYVCILLFVDGAACGPISPSLNLDPNNNVTTDTANSNAILPYTAEDALFASLPHGADALAALCAPPVGQDDVVSHLCATPAPVIHGIKDLQNVLGLGFADATGFGSNGGTDGNPYYAITGHSSSLVVAEVSAINPRTIVCQDFGTIPGGTSFANPNYFSCMGFTRGENFVEVATTDAGTGILQFYIIKFETACSAKGTCTAADVLTPAADSNWVSYSAYEDDPYFKNTILDCRQCHQSGGMAEPILRMQETTAPYTHFFSSRTAGGQALLSDFWTAHGQSESLGPIPAPLMVGADGNRLAAFLSQEGFLDIQPNVFPSAAVEAEVEASSPQQPSNNTLVGTSATWNAIFAGFQNGNDIAPPYHDVKITDPNKLLLATSSYQGVMNGTLTPAELIDIRAIFPSNPNKLAQMGMAAVPGQTAAQIITNVCSQCHNATLNQSISRANFNVASLLAGTMTALERQIAVSRIQKPSEDLQLMPPKRYRVLQASEIELLVNYLEQQQ